MKSRLRTADRAGSVAQAETEQEDGFDHAPPAGDRLHLGLPESLGGIDLGHRHLQVAIAELDRLELDVALDLIVVEPALIDLERRIVEQAQMDRPEAVAGVGQPGADEEAEEERMDETGGDRPV